MLKNPHQWEIIKESIYSTAISGNRQSEIMAGTINRLKDGRPVSDRYILGLVWAVQVILNPKLLDTPEYDAMREMIPAKEEGEI